VELRASWQRLPLSGLVPAIFEAAILPGLVLGVAATCAPRFYLQIGSALARFSKSTVRGAEQIRQKTREMLAEAQEQIQDIVAEADAENNLGPTPSKGKPAAGSS
jgi:hypothetical protein